MIERLPALLAAATLALPAAAAPAARELATMGGGCFWCTEAIFEQIRGVEDVASGYSGGAARQANYQDVSNLETGHAEVVQISFDPGVVSYRELLEVFFTLHDPTTLDRQGADVGTQYRSVVFYHSERQAQDARAVVADFQRTKVWPNRIVTDIEPFTAFYLAEKYHQDYYANNKTKGYCMIVIAPKIAKLRTKFLARLKSSPDTRKP